MQCSIVLIASNDFGGVVMKIELSQEVKDYLHKKHKEVLEVYAHKVYYERIGEPIKQLEIRFGTPDSSLMDQFEAFDVEGFKLYIEKDIMDENKDIMIHMSKILGFKYLDADGLEVHV